jgi:hypothetical protein
MSAIEKQGFLGGCKLTVRVSCNILLIEIAFYEFTLDPKPALTIIKG